MAKRTFCIIVTSIGNVVEEAIAEELLQQVNNAAAATSCFRNLCANMTNSDPKVMNSIAKPVLDNT